MMMPPSPLPPSRVAALHSSSRVGGGGNNDDDEDGKDNPRAKRGDDVNNDLTPPPPLDIPISQREGMEESAATPCLWSLPVVALLAVCALLWQRKRKNPHQSCSATIIKKDNNNRMGRRQWWWWWWWGRKMMHVIPDRRTCFDNDGWQINNRGGRGNHDFAGTLPRQQSTAKNITIKMWWGCEVEVSASSILGASVPCLRGIRVAMINIIHSSVTTNDNEYGGGDSHNSTRDYAVAIIDHDDKTMTLATMMMTILRWAVGSKGSGGGGGDGRRTAQILEQLQ